MSRTRNDRRPGYVDSPPRRTGRLPVYPFPERHAVTVSHPTAGTAV